MGNRIDKYAKKISGDVVKNRIDAQKDQMVRLETVASRDFEKIEIQVKQIINGVPTFYEHFYMAFAKEIYSKQKKFKSQTLINELAILDDKWKRRGLDVGLLTKIKEFYVPIYGPVARFDVGKFDVNTFG